MQFFEVSVCSAFFVFNLERRKHFIWYLILYFVLAIGLIFLFSYLRMLFNDSTLIRMILTLLIYIFAFGMINLLFKSSMVMNCTITIRILAVRELTDAIFNIIILLSGNDTRYTIEIVPNAGNYVNALLYDVIHIACHLTFALIFNSKLINQEKDKKLLSQYGVLGLIIVSFMCVIKTFVLEYEPESYILYILSMVLIGLLSLCVLAMQYFILKGRDYRQEINLMERVLYFEKKQYETVKESIESINMKCHDIKHQLDNFQGKLTTEEVELLKKSVEIYDLSIRTGNQNLDTILYEKQLLCNKHQIRLDVLADGQAIYFMSDVHLYTLLNNALTNALESVSKVEPTESKVSGVYDKSLKTNIDHSKPRVLIYHTHTTEGYSDGPSDTVDNSKNVVGIGEELTRILENDYGISVIHDKTNHYLSFTTCYEVSGNTVKSYLPNV